MIDELCEVQASGGLGEYPQGQVIPWSGLVNRPFTAQIISANKDLANMKPSTVVFDTFYTYLEKKVSDLKIYTSCNQ